MPLPLPLASLSASLSQRRGSLLVGTLLTSVFARIRSDETLSHEDPRLSASLASVLDARSPWTAAVAQLVHFGADHLALNLVALWQLGPSCEARGGGKVGAFLWTSFQLLTLSGAIFIGGLWLAARRFGAATTETKRAVGYSAVLFGWMSLQAAEAGPHAAFRLFGTALKLPALFSPLFLIFATSILLPNASLWGHLAGFFSGLVVALGGIEWLTPGLAATLTLWVGAAALFWRRAAEMEAAAAGDPESGGLLGSSSSPSAASTPRIVVF